MSEELSNLEIVVESVIVAFLLLVLVFTIIGIGAGVIVVCTMLYITVADIMQIVTLRHLRVLAICFVVGLAVVIPYVYLIEYKGDNGE